MPIIVYWRVWNFGQLGTSDIAGIIFASLIFGLMLYKLVEKRHFIWWHVGLLWLATMILCKMGRDSDGFKQFMHEAITMPEHKRWTWNTDTRLEKDLSHAVNSYFNLVFWTMGQKVPPDSELKSRLMIMGDLSDCPRIILMGDSHAAHFYAGMDDVFQDEKLSGIYLASIVFPFHNYSYSNPDDLSYCTSREKEDALVYWLAAHPELNYIILSHHWTKRMQSEEMFNRLKSYLQRLKSINKNVLIIGPTPQFSDENVPTHYYKIARIRGLNLADVIPHYTFEQHLRQNKRIIEYFRKLECENLCVYVDPFSPSDDFPSFYENKQCMVDQDHLSATGSIWLVKKILPQIKRAMDHQSCTEAPDERCSE